MSEYINKMDALDILDQFEDAVENGEEFYSTAREMMTKLDSVEITYCKDCEYYDTAYKNMPLEYGYCCRENIFESVNPSDFCSKGYQK